VEEKKSLTERPEWAKAAIVAEYQVDESDVQSDHFSERTVRRVLLAWSRTARNSFAELRKAAATFKPTEHLGPGRDEWIAIIVLDNDVTSNGSNYFAGERSHWHHELNEIDGRLRTFGTKGEAEEFAATLHPESITFGSTLVNFRVELRCESYEHRENYSMGRGLVLGACRYRTGWTVRKRAIEPFSHLDELADPEPEEQLPSRSVQPTPEAVAP
jgi:hypothetical protein